MIMFNKDIFNTEYNPEAAAIYNPFDKCKMDSFMSSLHKEVMRMFAKFLAEGIDKIAADTEMADEELLEICKQWCLLTIYKQNNAILNKMDDIENSISEIKEKLDK